MTKHTKKNDGNPAMETLPWLKSHSTSKAEVLIIFYRWGHGVLKILRIPLEVPIRLGFKSAEIYFMANLALHMHNLYMYVYAHIAYSAHIFTATPVETLVHLFKTLILQFPNTLLVQTNLYAYCDFCVYIYICSLFNHLYQRTYSTVHRA